MAISKLSTSIISPKVIDGDGSSYIKQSNSTTAAIIAKINQVIGAVNSTGTGTTDHSELTEESRALEGQHPIGAITDLATTIIRGDGSVVWITTTGSFSIVAPEWANCMYVSGAGGAGGGNASHGLGGGGGMSINRARYAVTGGATLSGSIGTGGAGATSYNSSPGNVPGTNGGNTVLTGFVTLHGGYGGGNHPSSQWYGGAGGGAGSTSGGMRSLMVYGGTPTSVYVGGDGGDSLFGKGGKGGYYPNNYGGITSVNGSNGIGFGGGGGGGGTDSSTNVTSGGNGSPGFLAIEFAYEA